MKTVILLLTVFLAPAIACAETTSEPCKNDPRVRCTDYDADKIVEIVVDVGYQASIFLDPGEKITDKGFGYPDGWEAEEFQGYSGFYLKAMTKKPDTNLTVVTDKRKYLFEVRMKELAQPTKDPKAKVKIEQAMPAMYALKFRYGREDKPESKEAKEERETEEIEVALNTAKRKKFKNANYWVQGSEAVTPAAAYDDGTFTYLNFPPNMDLPSVFLVDADGEESLANKHMDNDTLVIEHVSRKMLLRRGTLVAAIYNEAYDQHGIENESKTVSPDVKRKIKTEKKGGAATEKRAIVPAVRSTPAPIEERKIGGQPSLLGQGVPK